MIARFTTHAAGVATVLGLVAIWPASAARAQTADHLPTAVAGVPPPQPMQAIDNPPIERLFGDWDGAVDQLGRLGIDIRADAVSEFAGNVSGGTRQGATFANQIGVSADVNWEKLAGLTGLSTHVIAVSRSGSSDSALFGDHLLPVQEVYGSGGDVAVHLVSFYAQETLFDRGLDIAVGRMNVENDFASSPLFCDFMNNGLCGDPKALPGGDIGHSAYPDAVWAGRIKVRPIPDIYVTTGVYEVSQGLYSDALYRSGFQFNGARDSGVYLPLEVGWEPKLGADRLPGHYKVGFGYDTSSGYMDFGNPLARAGVSGYAEKSRSGNAQVWALADQMLLRNADGDGNGVIGLAGFIHNDPNNSAYAEQYYLGLVDHGFWRARPDDGIGMLFLYNTVSSRLGNVQAAEIDIGLPISNSATGVQGHEIVLEVDYDFHVLRGVTFRPEFEYVIRPNAQSNIQDAAVLGFKFHVQL
jgi:porin